MNERILEESDEIRSKFDEIWRKRKENRRLDKKFSEK